MKYNIRQRVINEYGLPVTKIEQVNGELGSGLFDKNGREIFEGDKLKIETRDWIILVSVKFESGTFMAGDRELDFYEPEWVEITGHVGD